MRNFLLSILFLVTPSLAREQLRIAVVDTGLNLQDPRFSELLCDKGTTSVDFTNTSINDTIGHGTHITGLIKEYAGDSNYCLIILKYYLPYSSGLDNLKRTIKAFAYAAKQNVSIVNYSGGGGAFDETEMNTILNNKKITFIVAAGNDNINLDKNCYYYPACYNLSNIIVVGSNVSRFKKAPMSNYGRKVEVWETGENVLSTLVQDECKDQCLLNKGYMSGTSQATAIFSGKTIYERTH